MTTTQTLTEGATITLAGRTLTVGPRYGALVTLDSDRATYVATADTAYPVKLHTLKSEMRRRGNPVLVQIAGDQLTVISD